MNYKRLELTWIGKDEEPTVEPRIPLHDAERDYGDPNAENMLVHGDNLLALKALEQEYSGRVKCICIDPPYNTGSAFEYYDDNLEHSIWLGLMRSRLELLCKLLSEDGSIWIWLDKDGMGVSRKKTYLADSTGVIPWIWWTNKEVGHNQEAKKEINVLFGSSNAFDTPKARASYSPHYSYCYEPR